MPLIAFVEQADHTSSVKKETVISSWEVARFTSEAMMNLDQQMPCNYEIKC